MLRPHRPFFVWLHRNFRLALHCSKILLLIILFDCLYISRKWQALLRRVLSLMPKEHTVHQTASGSSSFFMNWPPLEFPASAWSLLFWSGIGIAFPHKKSTIIVPRFFPFVNGGLSHVYCNPTLFLKNLSERCWLFLFFAYNISTRDAKQCFTLYRLSSYNAGELDSGVHWGDFFCVNFISFYHHSSGIRLEIFSSVKR